MPAPLRSLAALLALGLAAVPAVAQGGPGDGAARMRTPNVEFDMMTWQEVKAAIAAGKTTALVYNGGTEQRGPQNVNGGHTLMGRETARAIALQLGDAIAAPVMPFSVNRASAELPGTIGLSAEVFSAVNEEVAEQLIISGFRKIVLMGDHGGGQEQLADVAKKLDAKHQGEGVRVVYCDEVYSKANDDFNKWLLDNGYPASSHAGIMDTSEMMYLGGDHGWFRPDKLKDALGDPVLAPGQQRDPDAPRVNNGVTGDGRRSTRELGKKAFDLKVQYAVRQIRTLLG
jgi:creatinine amidohydrolase